MEAAQTPLQFWTAFTQRCADVKDRADEVAAKVSRQAITRENGVEEIDKLVAEVSGIQRVATETTVMLPPYDVRRTQEEIQALQKKLQQLRDSFAPKKKFAFKSRASKPSSSSSKETAASAVETKQEDAATPAQETVTPYPPNTNVICDKAGEVLRVTRDQMGTSNDVLIKDCSDSTIFIPHVLGFARLETVSRCTVVLGPVAGACYLEGCTDSTIAVCCHQLRIHNTQACQIYTTVSTNPIIEDCTELGFAPFSITYADLPAQVQEANLQHARNWNSVVDFKWLRAQRSPNWYEIEESARKQGPLEQLSDVSFAPPPSADEV